MACADLFSHGSSLYVALGLVLISDAIAALGLPPGKHCLGTVQVDIRDNMATVAGSKTLAGRSVQFFLLKM